MAGHARAADVRDTNRFVQNLHLARMLCAGQKLALKAQPNVRAITDGMPCTSRRRFVQKLPKTTCEGCFEELTGTCFGANSFRGKSFCEGMSVGISNATISPVAKSLSQFQNDKKSL